MWQLHLTSFIYPAKSNPFYQGSTFALLARVSHLGLVAITSDRQIVPPNKSQLNDNRRIIGNFLVTQFYFIYTAALAVAMLMFLFSRITFIAMLGLRVHFYTDMISKPNWVVTQVVAEVVMADK